jgi:predicted GNAT superfamily acetyltransferase
MRELYELELERVRTAEGEAFRLARRVVELEAALRPFVEEFDFHAADYLADGVDGEEARVFTARTVELLIEHQKTARAALAGDGGGADG